MFMQILYQPIAIRIPKLVFLQMQGQYEHCILILDLLSLYAAYIVPLV